MEDMLDDLLCNSFDKENFVDAHLTSSRCSGFFTCGSNVVRAVNLSAHTGSERCSIVNVNLTRLFTRLAPSASAAVNLTTLDLRSNDTVGVALRLPRGLNVSDSLRDCAIWTDGQFAAADTNARGGPCCEVAPYRSPCVEQFMALYTKYTGLVECQICRIDRNGELPLPPTCSDGVANGNETGIDCGGGGCPTTNCCQNGYRDADERGVDCGGSCSASCSSGGTSCSTDDDCCVRAVHRQNAPLCNGTFSPRCFDAGCLSLSASRCGDVLAGWQADNTCRPLARAGICKIGQLSCLSTSEYTPATCQAVARPDATIVFATCDAACRIPGSCQGTWNNDLRPSVTELCYTSGQHACPDGSTCDAGGRCSSCNAMACAQPDTVYGGCTGVCKTFPCITNEGCACIDKIAPTADVGVCSKFAVDNQSVCLTRSECNCNANAVELHLQCDIACIKGSGTCTPMTPSALWTLRAICKVDGERCRMPSGGDGVCTDTGRCVFVSESAQSTTSSVSASLRSTTADDSTATSTRSSSSSVPATPTTTTGTWSNDSSLPVQSVPSIHSTLTDTDDNDAEMPATDDTLVIVIGTLVGGCCLLALLLAVGVFAWKRRVNATPSLVSTIQQSMSNEYASVSTALSGTDVGVSARTLAGAGVYGAAPRFAGSDGSSSDAVDARPGDARMVIYDRALISPAD